MTSIERKFGGYYDGGDDATAEKTGEAENKTDEGKSDKEVIYPDDEQTVEEKAAEAKVAEEKKTEEEKEAETKKAEEGKKEEGDKKTEQSDLVKTEDLQFPEGIKVDDGIKDELVTLVNDKDMTPAEKAQALIGLQQKLYTAQVEAHQEQVTAWEAEVNEDKEIIGDTGDKMDESLATAKKGMEALKVEGLSELLKSTGFGSHPLFVKAFFRIGKAIGEDSFHTGGIGGKTEPKSDKDVLYPNQT